MFGVLKNVRQFVCGLVAITLLMSCAIANANFITNDDIDSVNVTAPALWQVYNVNQLFDGIEDRYTNTRFAAYHKNGDLLSNTNVFNISVMLSQNFDVTSLAFFNDWRHSLNQQVAGMNIGLYDDHQRLLWHDDFTNLQQNSWMKIELAKFDIPVFDVRQIEFNVTAMQSDHFEIRELQVGTLIKPNSIQSSVNNASVTGIIVLFAGGVFAMMFRLKRRHF